MSGAKFTPGPWSYTTYAKHTALPGFPAAVYALDRENGEAEMDVDDGTFMVCDFDDVDRRSKVEQIANARLIAAAPELYAALQHCLEHLQFIRDHGPGLIAEGSDAVNEGLAAIAKADGR